MNCRACRWGGLLSIYTLLLLAILPVAAAGDASIAWSPLNDGPYGVGFESVEFWDHTRVIRSTVDYLGQPLPGIPSRPIQVAIWYPTMTDTGGTPIFYGEYSFLAPAEAEFVPFASEMQAKDIARLGNLIQPAGGSVMDVVNLPMRAVRSARPQGGKYPLVLYHPDANSSYCDNVAMCEYLASHGFVVAATHAYGFDGPNPTLNQRDIECQVRDLEQVLTYLQTLAYVDNNRVGLIGCGSGALVALLLQMRTYGIRATACLDPVFTTPAGAQLIEANPFFDPMRSATPLMVIYRSDAPDGTTSTLDKLRYSERQTLGLTGISPSGFTSHQWLASAVLRSADSVEFRLYRRTYIFVVDRLRRFFFSHVSLDSEDYFGQPSPQVVSALEKRKSARRSGEPVPPTRRQFLQVLQTHGAEAAIELYNRFHALDTALVLFDEASMNAAGYRAFQTGQTELALTLFRINTETYPNSANCWDSYAEALVTAGRTGEARVAARTVLEKLDADQAFNEAFRQTLRETNEARLRELGE